MFIEFFISLQKSFAPVIENVTNTFSTANLGNRARFIITGIIALMFTLGILQWSFIYGRLAIDITWDDVAYFQDAYLRIKTLYEKGFLSMLAELYNDPPHSPYSSLLAFIGFALFGPRDWVPYLMNFITIFTFIGFLAYIMRNINFIISTVILILFLCVPLSFFAVHEFRPDSAVAIFTCIFSFLAFESLLSKNNYDVFRLRFAGVVFGLALLCKPSFFAHTLAISFVVSCLIVVYRIIASNHLRQQVNGKDIIYMLRDFYLPGILLAFPYYALNWLQIWNYFLINTRGKSSTIWNFNESISYWGVLKSFTFNGPAYSMISSYLFLFSGVIIYSFLFFLYKRKWYNIYFLTGLIAVAIANLAIIVYGRHDNVFFGLTYQTMICFAMCYCLSSLYRNKISFAFNVLIFIAFTGWYMGNNPLINMINNSNGDLVSSKRGSINFKIVKAIEDRLTESSHNFSQKKVFFSFAGEVNSASCQWLALQKSLPLKFSDLHREKDIDEYKKAISESDFVVVTDEDADGIYHWLPSFLIQKPILNFLQADPFMEEILIQKTNRNAVNGYIRLFANNSKLKVTNELQSSH